MGLEGKALEEISGMPVVTKETEENSLKRGERKKLPSRRAGYNQKVRIGGTTFYVRTGEYEDGSLGELFINCAKAGSSMRAMIEAVAISMSIGLQCGTPLEAYVRVFKNFGFLPSGDLQGDERFTGVQSILDYVARELELTYLSEPK